MKERSRRKIQKIEEGVKKLEERREGDVLYHIMCANSMFMVVLCMCCAVCELL